jgi:hypothetical protein
VEDFLSHKYRKYSEVLDPVKSTGIFLPSEQFKVLSKGDDKFQVATVVATTTLATLDVTVGI